VFCQVPAEISILTKEHFNRWYSLKSYYIATNILDVPITVSARPLVAAYPLTDNRQLPFPVVADARLFDIFRDHLPDDRTTVGMGQVQHVHVHQLADGSHFSKPGFHHRRVVQRHREYIYIHHCVFKGIFCVQFDTQ